MGGICDSCLKPRRACDCPKECSKAKVAPLTAQHRNFAKGTVPCNTAGTQRSFNRSLPSKERVVGHTNYGDHTESVTSAKSTPSRRKGEKKERKEAEKKQHDEEKHKKAEKKRLERVASQERKKDVQRHPSETRRRGG